jgi:uncharacterized protein (DUF302 family)
MKIPYMPRYGMSVTTALSFEEAIERVTALLKEEGFGVLCDIDVSNTLRDKIGAETPPYRILGACNPAMAYRALAEEPWLGLLLPCNVVVQVRDGYTEVCAVDAISLLSLVNNPALQEIASDVNARFRRILKHIVA